jgi:uncharacterized protein YecT (DUF1311 family)
VRVLLPSALFAGLCAAAPAIADAQYDKCIDESDGTNVAWDECRGDWIERADKALNAVWRELRKVIGNTAKALLDDQTAWNDYKEKSCLFYANGDSGREGEVLSCPACRARVIEARTTDLKSYLKDVQVPD